MVWVVPSFPVMAQVLAQRLCSREPVTTPASTLISHKAPGIPSSPGFSTEVRSDVGRGTRGTRKAPVSHPNITHMYKEEKTAKQQKSKKNF